MWIEQGPSVEFVATRLDGGSGARVLVRRGAPLKAHAMVVANRGRGAPPELFRVGQLCDGTVELLPAAESGRPMGERWLADTAAVVGTLLLRWQCGDAAEVPSSAGPPPSR